MRRLRPRGQKGLGVRSPLTSLPTCLMLPGIRKHFSGFPSGFRSLKLPSKPQVWPTSVSGPPAWRVPGVPQNAQEAQRAALELAWPTRSCRQSCTSPPAPSSATGGWRPEISLQYLHHRNWQSSPGRCVLHMAAWAPPPPSQQLRFMFHVLGSW